MRKSMKRGFAAILTAALVLQYIPEISVNAEKSAGEGKTYYVDQDGGNDANSGTSEKEAWSSLEKVNETTFQPGDKLLFEKGDEWVGQLSPKGSGEEGNPIVIGSYGDGNERPLISGNNWCGENGDDLENRIFNAAVYFYNQQYWEITDLEVTNRIPGDNPDDHIKKYGVLIMGEDAGTLRHMYCKNLDVHDVVSHPIGNQAGIGRGGIVYIIRGNEVPTNWDDILIEGNQVGPNINHYGISFLSTWGSSSFPAESGIPANEYADQRVNSTNIVIRNNYCEDVGNAAICPSAYSNALIEYNVCDGCNSGPNGNVPIWWEYGDYTVAQFNEVFGSGASDSKEDSQAFDADVAAKKNYIQYNYTHDNPSGAFFECALGSKYETHIRYNVSQNDGSGTNSYGGGAIVTIGGYSTGDGNKLNVYNNDFYLAEGYDSWITNNWDGREVNPETYQFRNNVIYSDGESKGWHQYLQGSADHNAYGGSDKNILRADDENAVSISKADFKAIGTGASGIDSVDGYQLAEGSACINAGTLIEGNGGRDYWGNPVSITEVPNIGADNKGAAGVKEDYGIDFEDRAAEEKALTGEYEGCNFGEGWLTEEVKNSKVLYADGTKTTYLIELPDNRTLESFQAFCEDSALVTLSGNGYEREFAITSAKTTYLTDFPSALKEVKIEIVSPKGSGAVKFDNLVLREAQYERNNIARGKYSWEEGKSQYPASNGNDGDEDTLWVHEGNDKVGWMVDLGQDYDLSDFELVFENEGDVWKYELQGARDGDQYFEEIPIYDATDNTDGSKVQKGSFEPGTVYRYVLVKLTDFPAEDYWPGFAEFKLYARDYSELDKSELTKLISEVKYMKPGNYTDESYANLRTAFEQAKKDFEEADTKEKVSAAIEKLQEAIDALKIKEGANLALGKPTKSSTQNVDERPSSNGNDGDESTLWVATGNYEDTPLPHWWQVDLEKEYVLDKYRIVFEDDKNPGAWKYRIEGSKDGENFDVLFEQKSSPDGTREDEQKIQSKESYRYVRVVITDYPEWEGADYWTAFAEFEVYGSKAGSEVVTKNLEIKLAEAKAYTEEKYTEESYKALQEAIKAAEAVLADEEKTQAQVDEQVKKLAEAIKELEKKEDPGQPGTENLALNKPTTSSTKDIDEKPSSNGNDGKADTLWVATGNYEDTPLPHWWQVDLGKEYALDRYKIMFEEDQNSGAWKYRVEGSKDGENFDVLFEQKDSPDGTRVDEQKIQSGETYRYVRVVITGYPEWDGSVEWDYWTAMAEFEVYEKEVSPSVDKSGLENKLKEAKDYKADGYTAESYATLQKAIEEAESVLADEKATQDALDAQVVKLETAISVLDEVTEPEEPEDPKDPTPNPDKEHPVDKPGDQSDKNIDHSQSGKGQNNSGSHGGKLVQTGDEAPIMASAFLMMAAMVVIFGVIVRKKRR